MKIIKAFCFFYTVSLIFLSCTGSEDKQAEDIAVVPTVVAKVETDTVKLKIQHALEKIASADLEVGGFKLVFLNIDSLRYKTVSIKDFYQQRKENLERSREEYRKINERLARSGIKTDQSKYLDDSLKSNKAVESLTNLIAKADTAKTIYSATYRLNAKTNTTSYNTIYTKFLFVKDLTEVKMQFGDIKK